jgi:hypothetical protein
MSSMAKRALEPLCEHSKCLIFCKVGLRWSAEVIMICALGMDRKGKGFRKRFYEFTECINSIANKRSCLRCCSLGSL